MNTLYKSTKPLIILLLLLSFNALMQQGSCRVLQKSFYNQEVVHHVENNQIQEEAKLFLEAKSAKQASPSSGPNKKCYTPVCARK